MPSRPSDQVTSTETGTETTRSVRIRAASAIAYTLSDLGVTDMFGLIGDANFEISDDADRLAGIRFIPAQHENAAIAMADTYARVTGRPGIATVTRGPGVTNAVTALLESSKAGTPLLLIAGDVGATETNDPQLIDQRAMWQSLSIPVLRYRGPEFAAQDVAHGLRRAVAEQTPIVFSIPGDHQSVLVDHSPPTTAWVPTRVAAPNPTAIDDVIASLEQARNPVILGGWGAVRADAEKSLRRLGDRIGSLFATTAAAHGLFGDSEWCVGVSGGFSTSLGRELLGAADLVLAFGASLSTWTTRGGTLYRDAAVYLFNDRSKPVDDTLPATSTLISCDALLAAEVLMQRLEGTAPVPGYRRPEISTRIAQWNPSQEFTDASSESFIDPRTLMILLDKMLPEDRIIVTDTGHASTFPFTFLRAHGARGSIFSQYYLSVGFGLPNLVGAAVGADHRCVVAVIGDGGALMSLGELATLATRPEPALAIIMNDRAYGIEVHMAKTHSVRTDLVTFPTTDFAAVASAFGIRSHVVRAARDLDAVGDWFRCPHGPLLLDCRVNRDVLAPFMAELLPED